MTFIFLCFYSFFVIPFNSCFFVSLSYFIIFFFWNFPLFLVFFNIEFLIFIFLNFSIFFSFNVFLYENVPFFPSFNDGVTSMSHAVLNRVLELAGEKNVEYWTYIIAYNNFRITTLDPNSIWTWIFAGLGTDHGQSWIIIIINFDCRPNIFCQKFKAKDLGAHQLDLFCISTALLGLVYYDHCTSTAFCTNFYTKFLLFYRFLRVFCWKFGVKKSKIFGVKYRF